MRKEQGLGPCVLLGVVSALAGCSSGASPAPTDTGGASAGNGVPGTTAGSAGSDVGLGGSLGTAGGAGVPNATGGGEGGSATVGGASAGAAGSQSGTGGASTACASSPGAAFAPLTSYTAKDGGFGPVVSARNAGDETLGNDANGMPNKVAIFRPAAAKYGQGGVRHPVLVWGNGHTNTVDIWQGFLARVASYGFVVVAPEQSEVTADHMNKALDYVLGLANDPASQDCGKIDATKLGATGYSRGGMGAISVGSNARITSTFVFASNGNVKNLKAPWGVIGGEMDMTFDWSTINGAVSGATQPAFGAALAGIDHNRVAGQAKAQEALIGWMRWRFMADPAGHGMFVGASCQLCADTAFSATVRTPSLDSL